ncbi:MAG: NAD(P)H-hydrate dehydratase [Acidimicrobiales bacterium]
MLTVAETRAADLVAVAEVGHQALVERAGAAVARCVLDRLGGAYGRRVVVVAGRGSNGADGRVAARRLAERGVSVTVVPASGDGADPPQLPACDVVVDAAYGTGFRGRYRAPEPPPGAATVAVDIPSGVDGDTGVASEGSVAAGRTVTFASLKPGLCMGAGRVAAGDVEVADVGVATAAAQAWVVEDADVLSDLRPRPRDAHKWASALAVVAGSPGMLGAAALCARAAMRAGAGMVRLGVPGAPPTSLPTGEAVARSLPEQGWAAEVLEELHRCRALVVGPGLGRTEATVEAVRELVAKAPCPVVVDADGLWALGEAGDVAALARGRHDPLVLTPHAGEHARLAGAPAGPDALSAARDLARSAGAVVLDKGPTTVVAGPDGRALVCMSGSQRLATAGTGDVLSGVIGAFAARGTPALLAAALGAHCHGRAAALGPSEGLLAGDLPELVSSWLSGLRHG